MPYICSIQVETHAPVASWPVAIRELSPFLGGQASFLSAYRQSWMPIVQLQTARQYRKLLCCACYHMPQKSPKPFSCITEKGKNNRLRNCLDLNTEELQYLMARNKMRQKRDNQTCLHLQHFMGKYQKYVEISQLRKDRPTYYHANFFYFFFICEVLLSFTV
jgi:hypothetical protein